MHGKQEARGQGLRQGIGISIWRWQPRLPSNWWAAVESLFYANVARVLKLEASRLKTEDWWQPTADNTVRLESLINYLEYVTHGI